MGNEPLGQDTPPANEIEPLGWGIVANISRDTTSPDKHSRRRPGTRLFRPGAKVWVMPVMWGDGGEKRIVVGPRPRKDGLGVQWIRIVLNADCLVRWRVKPIYSPSLFAVMTNPASEGSFSDLLEHHKRVYGTAAYESKEDAEADIGRSRTFRMDWWGDMPRTLQHLVHPSDEPCEFCEGRDAYLEGLPLDSNPYGRHFGRLQSWYERQPLYWVPATRGYSVWQAGWHVAAALRDGADLPDPLLTIIADKCQARYQDASALASQVVGLDPDEAQRYRDEHKLNVTRFRWVFKPTPPGRIEGSVTAILEDDKIVQCVAASLTGTLGLGRAGF